MLISTTLILMQLVRLEDQTDPLYPYKVEERHESRPMYKIWVTGINKTESSGLLYSVEEDKLRISTWLEKQNYDIDHITYQAINAELIESIRINRKTKLPMFIGVVSGVVIGAVIGSQNAGGAFFGEWPEVAGAALFGGNWKRLRSSYGGNKNLYPNKWKCGTI